MWIWVLSAIYGMWKARGTLAKHKVDRWGKPTKCQWASSTHRNSHGFLQQRKTLQSAKEDSVKITPFACIVCQCPVSEDTSHYSACSPHMLSLQSHHLSLCFAWIVGVRLTRVDVDCPTRLSWVQLMFCINDAPNPSYKPPTGGMINWQHHLHSQWVKPWVCLNHHPQKSKG